MSLIMWTSTLPFFFRFLVIVFARMQKLEVLSLSSLARRADWIEKIVKISGRFGDDTSRIVSELDAEVKREGTPALVDHLRLCGSIPEHYGHDTTEEKLYSKYTDAVLAAAYRHIGLKSIVIRERADAADVEAVGAGYSLVGDAKAFRLSRTAKNQKDFKIEAMAGWKRGKVHAMVICPIYQLPPRISQIYHQAIARSVCVFSYSHMAVIAQLRDRTGKRSAQGLMLAALKSAEDLNPTKDSVAYWTSVNRAMLSFHETVPPLWRTEKIAMIEALRAVKEGALTALAKQREQIMRMSRDEAISRLIDETKIEQRAKVISSVEDNGILSMT
ncbi:MAG: HindIII family type II restriction endonuclease [Candidatus Acidiferrales bacterium]